MSVFFVYVFLLLYILSVVLCALFNWRGVFAVLFLRVTLRFMIKGVTFYEVIQRLNRSFHYTEYFNTNLLSWTISKYNVTGSAVWKSCFAKFHSITCVLDMKLWIFAKGQHCQSSSSILAFVFFFHSPLRFLFYLYFRLIFARILT